MWHSLLPDTILGWEENPQCVIKGIWGKQFSYWVDVYQMRIFDIGFPCTKEKRLCIWRILRLGQIIYDYTNLVIGTNPRYKNISVLNNPR